MGDVIPLRSIGFRRKRNVLAFKLDAVDNPWFAAHPDRRYWVRPLCSQHEIRQAQSLHGSAGPGPVGWCLAVRRDVERGIAERRFISLPTNTQVAHLGEYECRALFEHDAFMAGIPEIGRVRKAGGAAG